MACLISVCLHSAELRCQPYPPTRPSALLPPQEFKRRNAPCLRWLAGLDLLGSLNLQVSCG